MRRGGAIAASRRRVTASPGGPPSVVLNGVYNAGTTGSVTYAIPAGYAINDLLFLSIESGGTAGIATPPSGWALAMAPRPQGSNVTTISVLWRRAASLAETNPVVPGTTNHQTGVITVVRGATTVDDPFEIPVGSGAATAASLSHDVGITTRAQTLIMLFAASRDAPDAFGDFTNPSLSSVTKQNFGGTALGNAGSVDVVTGVRAVAGNAGTFSASMVAATAQTNISFAVLPG